MSAPVESGRARDAAAWDLLLAGVAVSLVVVHFAYWTAGQMYGPRYYFEAMGALALLSARGILQLAGALGLVGKRVAPARGRAWATAGVLLVVVGLFAGTFTGFAPQEFARYTGWYDITGDSPRAVQAAGLHNAVVFVRAQHWTDYAPFFCQNVPTLDGDVVYALDLGERDRDLMALYPGRSFYSYAFGRLVPLP